MDLGMKPDIEYPSTAPGASRNSTLWDIYIPIAIAGVPAAIFTLLGFVTDGLDKPGVVAPLWLIVPMIALQTLGIIAMAYVILVRFEFAFRQLSLFTKGNPSVWRKLALKLSIVCLLLFNILTNVSAAFAGAGPLFVAAVPAFFAYVLCKRIAFSRLSKGPRKQRNTA